MGTLGGHSFYDILLLGKENSVLGILFPLFLFSGGQPRKRRAAFVAAIVKANWKVSGVALRAHVMRLTQEAHCQAIPRNTASADGLFYIFGYFWKYT